MNVRSLPFKFIICLIVSALLSQVALANSTNNHQGHSHSAHSESIHDVFIQPSDNASDSHHGMHGAHAAHSDTETNLKLSNHAKKDCCDTECDCDLASCSVLYTLADVHFQLHYSSSSQNPIRKVLQVSLASPPLYRPPISQII